MTQPYWQTAASCAFCSVLDAEFKYNGVLQFRAIAAGLPFAWPLIPLVPSDWLAISLNY
jgi:hypothetical protein